MDDLVLSNIFNAIPLLLVSVFAYSMWYLWMTPMNRVRTLDDNVGYAHVEKWSSTSKRKAAINRLRKTRKAGQIPPPFPNSWHVIAESRDVTSGSVVNVTALGFNFAIFRGLETNRVFVTDAYCPHLGADITAGGSVKGDAIECPFHKWTFEGTSGQCIGGPSSQKTRDLAKLKTWTSVEINGLICIWYHADDEPPVWVPLPLPQVNSGAWVYQGRNEYHVTCHIQDIPENGADPAHLDAVHASAIIGGGEPSRWMEWLTQWTWHEWAIDWRPLEEAEGDNLKHRAKVNLSHTMTMMGRFNLFSLKVEGDQIGASIVHLHFQSFMGKGVMIQYVLPLGPMLQKVVHVFYTERSWLSPYAKLVLWGESILFERDVRVWNSKTYIDRPLAGREDALLLKHRRWFAQFYSKSSRSLGASAILDW